MLAIQEEFGDSFEFLENIKIDLYPDDIYVFLQRGYLIAQGATVMVAYAISEEVGNRCIAARVDRHVVPSTVLSHRVSVENTV